MAKRRGIKTSKKKVSPLGCLVLIGILLAAIFGSQTAQRGQVSSTHTAASQSTTRPVAATGNQTTVTTKKGIFTIPGTAFMDGEDPDAAEYTVVTPINIWDDASRQKVVCELNHGDKVELLDSKWVASEERHYFLIHKGACKGWVSEPFISMDKAAPTQVAVKPTNTPLVTNPTAASKNTNNQSETYFTTGNARARECARTDCAIITTFTTGTPLTVIGWVQGDAVSGNDIWRQIDHNGQTVFVHSSLLSVTAPRPTSPPVQAPVQVQAQPAVVEQQVMSTPPPNQPPSFVPNCSGNVYDCADLTCSQMAIYWAACPGDPSGLDGSDNDQKYCESKCGG